MYASPLHERLNLLMGKRTYREIGELTNTNSETVRRYMSGQTPSVEFVASLCRRLNVSSEWLLTGRGPVKLTELKMQALREADAGELLQAMATTMEKLLERVDRLERYTQSLETRIRSAEAAVDPDGEPAVVGRPVVVTGGEGAIHESASAADPSNIPERVRLIGHAFAQRPRPNDG